MKCGKSTALAPPMPGDTSGSDTEGDRLVMGMVLNFTSWNLKATTATGVFEVTVRVPSKSTGTAGTSEKNSLINLDICRRAATVLIFVEVTLPLALRSVIVTTASVLPGLVIATPTLRDKRMPELAKITVRVVRVPGRTAACDAGTRSLQPKV